MIVLGIDPGLKHCGAAVLRADGSMIAHCFVPVQQRRVRSLADARVRMAQELSRWLSDLWEIVKPTANGAPLVVAVEELTWVPGARGSGLLGLAHGAIAATFADEPIVQVQTREARAMALGRRDAGKVEVQRWAMGEWPAAGWGGKKVIEHQADAALVAWYAATYAPEVRLLSRQAASPPWPSPPGRSI